MSVTDFISSLKKCIALFSCMKPADNAKTAPEDDKTSASNDASNSKRRLILDGDVLDADYQLELGKMTKCRLQSGYTSTQVLIVEKQPFVSAIPPYNFFCTPLETDEEIVVKVYDPMWVWASSRSREITDEEYTELYQSSIDLCVTEIEAYAKLETLSGTVIPKFFGYCTIQDFTVSVGKIYLRAEGPSIFLESLENMRDPTFEKKDVTLEFVKTIVDAYSKLHALGVVHGDVDFKNILVTKDRKVKILDFDHAKIDATSLEMEQEIKDIYAYFGYKQ